MKNKNKPEEELKRIKGDLYFSQEEKALYRVKDDTQTPVPKEEVESIWKDIQTALSESGKTVTGIFETLGIKVKKSDDNDDSAFPFI